MTQAVPRRAVTLDELRSYREQIQATAARYGIRNVRVFGSVASVEPGHGYLDLTGSALAVEDLTVFTQVATPAGLTPRLRNRVLTRNGPAMTTPRTPPAGHHPVTPLAARWSPRRAHPSLRSCPHAVTATAVR